MKYLLPLIFILGCGILPKKIPPFPPPVLKYQCKYPSRERVLRTFYKNKMVTDSTRTRWNRRFNHNKKEQRYYQKAIRVESTHLVTVYSDEYGVNVNNRFEELQRGSRIYNSKEDCEASCGEHPVDPEKWDAGFCYLTHRLYYLEEDVTLPAW